MARVRQESFGAGELSPRLHGQPGDAAYARGLRRGRNVIVTKEGALASRPGMRYCGTIAAGATTARLVRFIYSDAYAYVLEFTPGGLQVWHEGVLVFAGLVTPYTADELQQLRFAASGDVLYITHGNHTPRLLTRVSPSNWTLTTLSFAVRAGFFHAGSPAVYAPTGLPAATTAQPAKQWRWCVTTVGRLADGTLFESAPTEVTHSYTGWTTSRTGVAGLPSEVACYQDMPITIAWDTPGLVTSPDFRVVAWRVYRGTGTRRGLLGEATADTGLRFIDFGHEPDYSQPPPQGRNPFEVYDDGYGVPALLRTEDPSAVAFHEERLCFARSAERPAYYWLSTLGDYTNFDDRLPAVADMALEGELPSRQREEVRSLLSYGDTLLAFTDAAVWALSAGGAPVLGWDTLSVRRLLEVGSSWAAPEQAGAGIFFARAKGRGVQVVSPSEEGNRLRLVDVSSHAGHLFSLAQAVAGTPIPGGATVVDMAYQEDPWGVLWVVLSTGHLLSFTLNPERGVLGWTWHDTNGLVKSVACVPEGGEDAVYLVVLREVDTDVGPMQPFYNLERMKGFEVTASTPVADCVCLDNARTQSGPPTTSVIVGGALGGLTVGDGSEPADVWALADGNVVGPLALTAPGSGEFLLTEEASTVHIGWRFRPQVESLDVPTARGVQKSVVRLFVDVFASRGLWAGRSWDRPGDFVEVLKRRVEDGVDALPLRTETVEVRVRSGWGTDGRVCLEQREPLPFVLVGLEREVEGGG